MISLKTKIAFFVTAVILAISSISVYLVIGYHHGQLEEEFIYRGKALVILMSRLASEGLAVEKMDLINRASYIINANDVIRVRVYTDLWDIIESYPPDYNENRTDIDKAAAYFSSSDAPFYLKHGGTYTFWGKVIYQPYENFKPITTGFVAIDFSSVRLEKAMGSLIASHIAAGIFVVIIAVMAVNLLINKLILGQVSNLYRSVKEFKRGSLPEIQGNYSDDEIGMLAREFHAMCFALNEREMALKENAAYIDSILRSSLAAIAATDMDFRIRYYNPAAENIFGYEAKEVIGKTVMEVHTKENVAPERFERAIEIVKNEGEYRYTVEDKKGGRRRVIESMVFGIKDNDGNLVGFVLMSMDVTDKKEAEARLALQYTITRILVESSEIDEAVFRILGTICFSMRWQYGEMWIVDKGSDRLKFGGKWCESEGCFSAFDAATRDMTFGKGEGLPGRVWESGQAAFIHNITADDNFLRTDAAIKDCLCCGFAFPVKSAGAILGVMSFFSRDIYELTDDMKEMFEAIGRQIGGFIERKNMEDRLKLYSDELQRSNKELEQFAYIVSHDLQQPLRGISGFAQLLEKRYKDKLTEEASEFISYITQGTDRMQRLITDLLSYSRITTRPMPFKAVDCNDIIKTTMMNLRYAIEESRAVITFERLPIVYADETQMIQLFQNLIGNAIKYRGAEQPLIQVSARRTDGEWIFSVADNGIGFDMEQSSRIFNVFHRLHTDSSYEGTGIGLAVCKKIVERHGGRIWVDSAKGKGSVFYFSLPEKGGAKQDNHA